MCEFAYFWESVELEAAEWSHLLGAIVGFRIIDADISFT